MVRAGHVILRQGRRTSSKPTSAVLGFLGITDVNFVTASGAAQIMMGAVDREAFLKLTLDQVRPLAT